MYIVENLSSLHQLSPLSTKKLILSENELIKLGHENNKETLDHIN